MLARRLFVALLGTCWPASAFAHVKWFVSYNLQSPPRPPLSVLSNHYFGMFCLVVGPVMFAAALLDHYLTRRKCILHRCASALTDRVSDYFPMALRVGVSGFFTAVFIYSCMYDGMILTPELHTRTEWICWLQLGIAILALWRRTTLYAGAGIVFLYCYGVSNYGLFHMLDYPIFLGVAAYLIIDSFYGRSKQDLAHSIMRIGVGVTLLWASIEKFAFPEWTFMLLTERPGIAFGFNPEFYMVAAGFVEFCAAYLLITGMLSARVAAMILLFIFVSAIIPFGIVDAIGHSVIIVVLAILTLSHNQAVQRAGEGRNIFATATLHTSLFFSTLILFIGLYYMGYYLSYQLEFA